MKKEPEESLDSGWRYRTACDHINPTFENLRINQETQTTLRTSLRVKDTGVQYSSPSESSDSDSSDSDDNIEGMENITVAKQYLNSHSLSSKDLYTAPA